MIEDHARRTPPRRQRQCVMRADYGYRTLKCPFVLAKYRMVFGSVGIAEYNSGVSIIDGGNFLNSILVIDIIGRSRQIETVILAISPHVAIRADDPGPQFLNLAGFRNVTNARDREGASFTTQDPHSEIVDLAYPTIIADANRSVIYQDDSRHVLFIRGSTRSSSFFQPRRRIFAGRLRGGREREQTKQ